MRHLTALLGLCLAAQAQNWPHFRGPMAAGTADGTNPPMSWDVEKGKNVLWRTAIPGISVSSPVIWESTVYAVTSISSDPKSEFRAGLYGDTEPAKDTSPHTWKLYAVDLRSGGIKWQRTICEGVPKTKRHPKASHSSPSPAVDAKRVIVWFGSEGLYAYDHSGRQLWKKDLGVIDAGWFFDPDYQWGVASSPVLWRDRVFLQADQQKNSFIACFDAATGKELWRTGRDEIPSWGTPAVLEWDGKAQLVTNGTKAIRAYDPMTGKLIWSLKGNSEITCPTPVAGGGLIYVAAGYPPIQPIYAVKWSAARDITLQGDATSNEHIAWSLKRGGSYQPTPLLYGGILYVCSNSGVLSAYDAKTGERLYQQRVAGKGGAFSASPIAADARIYLASEDGEVHVVKAGPKYETLASNPVGEVMMGTPAFAKGMLVIRTMKHLVAVGEPAPGSRPAGGY
jgi:outer membrane protein assembly factor BamB